MGEGKPPGKHQEEPWTESQLGVGKGVAALPMGSGKVMASPPQCSKSP